MQVFHSLSVILFCISSIVIPWLCCSIAERDTNVQRKMLAARNIKSRKVLVVAGNFSIDGELVNIAQYDIATKE